MQALSYEQLVLIDAGVEAVWSAITQPEIVSTYYLCPMVKLELRAGGDLICGSLAQPLISGKVMEVEPQRRLVHSFSFDPGSHPGVEAAASRVTYDLRADGALTVLELTHDQFHGDAQAYANARAGWPIILSGLKERVEGTEGLR